MFRRKGSLRNKIIIWSFVPTAIILVAVALVSLYAYQRVTENLVMERDRELTRLSADLLATELAAYTNPLADQFMAIFDGIVILDDKGNILAAEPLWYETRKPNWLKDSAFQQMFRSSQPVFSDIVIDRLRGDKIIVAVIPIAARKGEPGGGIAGFFRLGPSSGSALYQTVAKLRRGESNCAYLVDSQGKVIYHTNTEHVGADFSPLSVVQQVMNGQVGALRTRNFDGEEIVASYAPVPGTSWGLVTEESWAALTASSRRYSQFLILLLALGVAVPTAIVTVGIRRITQPIQELIRAAQEIASGNFDQRSRATTGDEMENLADQFNLMAGQLQESYTDLEQRVSDRTRELATLNTIATQVSRSLDLNEILNKALAQVLKAMDMERGQAFCLAPDGETLLPVAHCGPEERGTAAPVQLLANGGDVGEAVRAGQPVTRGGRGDTPLTMCVPLVARGKALGALRLESQAGRQPTAEELSLLAAIGHQIGVAVENAQLYEQAQQLAVVRERNRLARDLHDSVMQALYGVTLYAEAAARLLSTGQAGMAAGHLQEIRSTTQEALREMRLLIFELRPPILKSDGLAAALQARLEAVEGRVGIDTDFTAEGDCRLPGDVEEGLYRIAQEALNNTLKHALATSVSVRLQGNGRTVTLEIADDGIGFDPVAAQERGGFGLRGMEERANRLRGILAVESEPGAGTTIKVEVCR